MRLLPLIAQALEKLRPWGLAGTRLLYPRTCRVCDLPLPIPDHEGPLAEYLCAACTADLPLVEPPICSVCGAFYRAAVDGRAFRCDNCAGQKFAFDFAVAGYRAEGQVRELVHRFKYHSDVSLRSLLGLMLARVLADPRVRAESLSEWTLVPVPLHRLRQRGRQFNQSLELCRVLSETTGIPTVDAMRRVLPTDNQAGLSRRERLKNLRNAFAMRLDCSGEAALLRGKPVLLVDDVFTTGATTDACARVLRRVGQVEKVVVITVARG